MLVVTSPWYSRKKDS